VLDTTSDATKKIARDRVDVARALGLALEPVVDLCLETGLTSPELETMLRAVFVRRALAKLPPTGRLGKPASDVRVGLAVGLHRNEVRRLRSSRDYAGMVKRQRRHRAGRLMVGWTTDPKFTTAGGQPKDLPITSDESGPTFEDLARTYLPGISAGSALRELRRHSLVQILPDEIVRLRRLRTRPAGLSAANIAQASGALQRLTSTLLFNLGHADTPRLHMEMKDLSVLRARLPLVRAVLDRRARTFVHALDDELRVESSVRRGGPKSRVGLVVLAWEGN
jgi:hypothetical protein